MYTVCTQSWEIQNDFFAIKLTGHVSYSDYWVKTKLNAVIKIELAAPKFQLGIRQCRP